MLSSPKTNSLNRAKAQLKNATINFTQASAKETQMIKMKLQDPKLADKQHHGAQASMVERGDPKVKQHIKLQ